MSRTPDYVTTIALEVKYGKHDRVPVEVGSFVRPIEFEYVAAHNKENPRWLTKVSNGYWSEEDAGTLKFDKEKHIFCYCHFGTVAVHRDRIRRT